MRVDGAALDRDELDDGVLWERVPRAVGECVLHPLVIVLEHAFSGC
jgi:hypothetical protein